MATREDRYECFAEVEVHDDLVRSADLEDAVTVSLAEEPLVTLPGNGVLAADEEAQDGLS